DWLSRASSSRSTYNAADWRSSLQSMRRLPFLRLAERLAQQLPRPRQTRHHRADRHTRHLRDLLVGKVLELPKHDRLAIFFGKLRDRSIDAFAVGGVDQQGLGRLRVRDRRIFRHLLRLQAGRDEPPPVALEPVEASVADDGEDPATRLVPSEAVEKTERPQ